MSYLSKAQQGYFHAHPEKVGRDVVRDFDQATTAKQYARLPEHVEHRAHGGLAARLAGRHYFAGGRASGPHHFEAEHDERSGVYVEDGHGACQHFAHGGVSASHDPECPDHPMYAGGEADEDADEADEGEGEAAEYDSYDPGLDEEHSAEEEDEEPPAPIPEARPLARTLAARRYAQGGQAEEATMHLQGGDWQDDERNRSRSPLAARLAGARMQRPVLSRILRKPASRVP
ncbi:MAG TPA: hypothetical protein VF841_16775 [Anaeromyxobacter sp.]